MLIAMVFMTQVVGGDLLLAVWGGCTAVYLACGLLRRKKRGKKGRHQLLIGLLVTEVLVDVFCFSVFFPGGEYHNWGVGGMYVVFLWPVSLLMTYGIATVFELGEVKG